MSSEETARGLAQLGRALQKQTEQYILDLYFAPDPITGLPYAPAKPMPWPQTFFRNIRYRLYACKFWVAGLFRYIRTGECGECEQYY